MHAENFSVKFKDTTGLYEVSLHQVDASSKKTLSINGKNYKILGSDAAVSHLRSHMKGSDFTNIEAFSASVSRDIGSEKKESVVFERIVGEQNPTPVSAPEKQFWKWLSAFNSGDARQLREFKQHFKKPQSEASIKRDLETYDFTQGFKFVKVINSSPTELTVLLQEECGFGQFATLTVKVEAQKPHLIVDVGLSGSDAPKEVVGRMTEIEAVKAIEKQIDLLAEQGKFSGSVLVTKVGNPVPLVARSVGMADKDRQIANTPETRFNLASMGKMFTVVAIHQMVEEGKIDDVKDKIGKYLKSDISPELAEVTIEQLLTHTGGTGGATGELFEDARGPKDYMSLCKERKPEFPPGTDWKYSNYGFVLLGAIVEEVSQKSYYDCIEERIFQKAEMQSSDFNLKTDENPKRATGYIRRKEEGLVDNGTTLPIRGSPAGGAYSTVEDMNRFGEALLRNRLLNAESIRLISTPKQVTPTQGAVRRHEERIAALDLAGRPTQPSAPSQKHDLDYLDLAMAESSPIIQDKDGAPTSYYSLGFMNDDLWFGHPGREHGVNSELRMYPQAGYIVTVMGNLDPPAASNLAEFIGARLPAESLASALEKSSGTRFELERTLSGFAVEKKMPELLNTAVELVNKGEFKKASNLFFLLQSHLAPDARVENFKRLGNAFLEYGEKHSDVLALDCADFHYTMARQGDPEGGGVLVEKVHDRLRELANSGSEEQKKYVRNLFDEIRICDLLDPLNRNVEAPEWENLKSSNLVIQEAFRSADALQARIDSVDAPKPYHPMSQIIEIPDGERVLPIHVIVTGTRQEHDGKKEPIVILEPGLGCFSSDWQHVQDHLLPDIQAVSYDREGMAWSGKNESPSPERTIATLRTLLKDRGLEPPYLFVGHSYGGFLGQLFAAEFPKEIAGLVLVDSALESVEPQSTPPPQSVFDHLPPAAKVGYVQNSRGDFLDAQAGGIVGTIGLKTEHLRTYEEELHSALPRAKDLLLEKMKDNPVPFEMPVKVITAGVYVFDPQKSEEQNAADEAHWLAEQKLLVNRSNSSASEHLMAPNSDHFIMYYDHALIREQIMSFYSRPSH